MSGASIQTSGVLFEAVQQAGLFSDSKTFPDSRPKVAPDLIVQRFKGLLAQFVLEHFELPASPGADALPRVALAEHIDRLWPALTREDHGMPPYSTQIALPHPYVVPGGRFRESYYWDTYFTAEGLVASGRADLLEGIVKNFADLIERFGHIPNGNRTYFLSRSQPPFFCAILQLLERVAGIAAVAPFLPALEAEHRFWMAGQAVFEQQPAASWHAVALADGAVLNRYWDARNEPREEAFREDVALFRRAPESARAELYRNLRAGAESGWDYSSRWFAPGGGLMSIRTTELIPVDLNCLLFDMERQLAEWLAWRQDPRAGAYAAAAEARRAAILRYCWSGARGWFFDYAWRDGTQSDAWTLAGVYPLFVGLADEEQARVVAEQLERRFLRPGGLVTTELETGEQWDAPNGWAPLQWVAVQGLRRYQYDELARTIATRFVAVARRVYERTGKLMEKYDVCDVERPAGGGEYPLQDGFGWTNGVVRALMQLYELD